MATTRSTGGDAAAAPATAQERALGEALEDASVLLWYATREGKPVADKTVDDIVTARSALDGGASSAGVEARFWVAFRELAGVVQPVSVDSILATYGDPFGTRPRRSRRTLGDAAKTKKWYSAGALGVLIVLLLVQIYWLVVATVRTDLESHRTELDKIAGSFREVILDIRSNHYFLGATALQGAGVTAAAGMLVPSGAEPAPQGRGKVADYVRATEEWRVILDVENKALRGKRVKSMLYRENRALSWLTDPSQVLAEDGFGDAGIDKSATCEAMYISLAGAASAGDSQEGLYDCLTNVERSLVGDQLTAEKALLNSKSILEVLSQYVLPLLYGLLGSLAYILRTLSRDIRNVTFTRGSAIRYSLRWPLGMLGGVTVGLFFDPAHLTGVAAITPLGLAFLAGYGVELFFTGLDRMVRAFTGDETARPKAA